MISAELVGGPWPVAVAEYKKGGSLETVCVIDSSCLNFGSLSFRSMVNPFSVAWPRRNRRAGEMTSACHFSHPN